jgi:hypothetical protein
MRRGADRKLEFFPPWWYTWLLAAYLFLFFQTH